MPNYWVDRQEIIESLTEKRAQYHASATDQLLPRPHLTSQLQYHKIKEEELSE